MKWFKHDSTANMDAKLQEVLLDYGLEGYGLYWYCLELIAGKVEPGNLTFELEHDCRIIARNTGSTAQRVQEMMAHFVDLGLFENAQGTITCLKMAKVSDDYTAKLIRSEQSAKKPQAIENKEVPQTPTKSEKVPLEENRTEENREEQITTENLTPPTGSTAPEGADSVCSVCNGEKRLLVETQANGMRSTSFRDCNHCNGTGKEPTCNDGLQVVNSELTSEQPPKADKPLNVPFDDFWNLYNKKVGRKKSEAKWKRLTNKDRAAIMEHLPNYIRNTPDVQYRKNPETYLNNESWNDEIPQTGRNMSYPAQSVPRNNDLDAPIVPKTIQRQAMSDEEIARQKAELANVLKGVE